MTPARNSPPIDTDIRPPHTTIRIEGGMITPITDEQAVTATAKEDEKPSFFICGMSREPMPAASAVELPEMPAKNIETTTLTCPRPPGRCPTSARASRIRRSVMPATFIRLAASRKNGTASRMKEL